jgi:signal transduction histidine kinase
MLSEQVGSRLNDPEQLKARAAKLADFAVRTTQAFEEIVWAVNPRNDSLRSLFEYLTHFANELFDDTGIVCRFDIADDLPDVILPPEIRHGIFLVTKEALNNALKHSGASQVTLQVQSSQDVFVISVRDDGKGLPADESAAGAGQNGLLNMRQRIEALGGTFDIDSGAGRGTTIRIRLSRDKLALHKQSGRG